MPSQTTNSFLKHSLSLQLLRKLRHLLKQVTDQADVCNLEDGCIGVLINSSDNLAVLHTGQVLDSTRNTGTKVKLRRDILTSLADLQTVVCKTTVYCGSGGTNSGTESISKRGHQAVKLLLGLEATTARNNFAGSGQIRSVRLGQVLRNPFRGVLCLGINTLLESSTSTLGLSSGESGATDGYDLNGVGGLDGKDSIAGVNGANESCSCQ